MSRFQQTPETGDYRYGGFTETTFVISMEMSEECEPLVELYNDSIVAAHQPYELADRDFNEEYEVLKLEEVLNNPKLLSDLKAIQKGYIDEFATYGVTDLRLQ